MRRLAVLACGWLAVAGGCFSPFSWPDDRRAELPTDDALTRAADCLDRGDEAGAVPLLREYLAANPDADLTRAQLAEVLLRTGKPAEARAELERFAASADRLGAAGKRHLAHCHTRLMELARDDGDAYGEELHRGVGLLMLVRKWDADPDDRDEAVAEKTLARAATALRAALAERPGDARANLYLADVCDRLGQPSGALRRAAKAGLPDAALTPGERERISRGG